MGDAEEKLGKTCFGKGAGVKKMYTLKMQKKAKHGWAMKQDVIIFHFEA